MRERCMFAVASVAVAAIVTAPPVAGRTESPEARVTSSADRPDAVRYAEAMGVTVDEAARRLAKQRPAGEFEAVLSRALPGVFAGLWLQHQPDFRVVVAVTDASAAPRVRALAGPLAGDVEVRVASHTVSDLVGDAVAAGRTIGALGFPYNAGTDVPRGRAFVRVTDRARVVGALARAGKRLPATVDLTEAAELARDVVDMFAGNALSTCTSGYTVQNASGTRGITTAGHCPDSQSYGTVALTFQAAAELNSDDEQWHTAPSGNVMRARIYDGQGGTVEPNYRMVTGKVVRNSQALNTWVCKYGNTTGYTCGTITDKNFVPHGGANPTFIYVTNNGSDLVQGGDSGGPVFSGTDAYGLTKCEAGPSAWDMCYTAVNYVESGLSVTILTGPSNDDFGNSITSSGTSWTQTKTTSNASLQSGEPAFSCQSNADNTVWYTFTAPESGLYRIDTVGSNYDTVLAVYTGSAVNSLTAIDCNDDTSTVQSELLLTLMANTTYRVRVGGYNGQAGSLTLRGAKVSSNGTPTGFSFCANEGGTCSFSGTSDVIYGAHGVFVLRTGVSGSIACNTTTFGKDPDPGFLKSCYRITAGSGGVPSGFAWCANEASTCTWTGTKAVAYGNTRGRYALLNGVTTGRIPCKNSAFWDPDPGWSKACYTK